MKRQITSPDGTRSDDSFAGIARLLTGSDTPLWLVEHLERWAPALLLDRAVHEVQPTRKIMKQNLAKIRDAATTLAAALSDPAIGEFLELAGEIRIEKRGGLDHTLRTIAARADFALSSPSFPSKGGRGRAFPKEAIRPKVFCAIMIAETWKHFHGHYPGSRNHKAAAAAQAFWQAAGSTARGWGYGLNGWRQPFTIANSTAAQDLRAEYCRHLRLSERHGCPETPPGK